MAVPTDPDQTTIIGYILALIGLGGGGAKFVTHESRLSRLETDRERDQVKLDARFEKHDLKLDALNTKVDTINSSMVAVATKLDGLRDDIIANRDLYIKRRKQYIEDAGGEVDE